MKNGQRKLVGAAQFACPSGCGTELSTTDALREEQLPRGLRWIGVPCPTCGTSYTVEMTEAPGAKE